MLQSQDDERKAHDDFSHSGKYNYTTYRRSHTLDDLTFCPRIKNDRRNEPTFIPHIPNGGTHQKNKQQ